MHKTNIAQKIHRRTPQTMKIDRFMSWCSASGLRSPLKIMEKADTGYRYVVLDNEMAESFVDKTNNNKITLIDVPMDMCMSSPTSDGLADRLLFEKNLGSDSFFEPYLDVFPSLESFQQTLPRFWTQDRWELVSTGDQGHLLAAHELDQARLALSCDEWAQACVDTRSNFLPPNGPEYSLTPLLDMINHKPAVPTFLKDIPPKEEDESSRLQLQIPRPARSSRQGNPFASFANLFSSTRSMQEDEINQSSDDKDEVFISYGYFSNKETLLNYGFVIPDNPCNEENVTVQVIRQSPVTVTFQSDGTLTGNGVSRLRRYLATPKELEQWSAAEEDKANSNGAANLSPAGRQRQMEDSLPFLSRRNEIEVFALVGGTVEELAYETRAAAQHATEQKDAIVALYLQQRSIALERALKSINKDFPEVFG